MISLVNLLAFMTGSTIYARALQGVLKVFLKVGPMNPKPENHRGHLQMWLSAAPLQTHEALGH